jgi:hypothetical protein
MRVFTQFHTAQEHEQFLQNLQKERELKIRISELARYRRNGLTRHEECAHFEQERVQHEEWKEKRSVSYVFIVNDDVLAIYIQYVDFAVFMCVCMKKGMHIF